MTITTAQWDDWLDYPLLLPRADQPDAVGGGQDAQWDDWLDCLLPPSPPTGTSKVVRMYTSTLSPAVRALYDADYLFALRPRSFQESVDEAFGDKP